MFLVGGREFGIGDHNGKRDVTVFGRKGDETTSLTALFPVPVLWRSSVPPGTPDRIRFAPVVARPINEFDDAIENINYRDRRVPR